MSNSSGEPQSSANDPTLTRLQEAVGSLLLDSQASTAIIFTSLLEEHLRAAMAVKMDKMNSRMEKILFEGYGPLASLRSKIDVALALGILTDNQYKNAHNIRKVRNKFAHTPKKLNFETPTIAEICKRLSTYDGKEMKLMNTFVKAIDELVEHLNKEFKTAAMVRALRQTAENPPESRSAQKRDSTGS
jgi:DNA-binding MltR family transcriptional regulator